MSWLLPALALLLAWLAGSLSLAALLPGQRRTGDAALILGAGYLLGSLVAGSLLWLLGSGRIAPALLQVGLILAGVAALGGFLLRRRSGSLPAAQPLHGAAADPVPRVFQAAALVLLAIAFVAILVQGLALPILMWDAWNAWLAKSKAWHHAGSFLPALGVEAWLHRPAGEALGVVAAHYPEALPRWVAALSYLHGDWSDAVAALPWLLLWPAGGALLHGALRRQGAASGQALLATCALLTLPMVLAHATLAGYMDLWLAFAVLLAVLAGEAWLRERSGRWLLVFLAAVILLPAIKLEGVIYALLLLVSFLVWRLPRAVRLRLLLPGAALIVATWWTVGFSLPIPGFGAAEFHRNLIKLPMLGSYALAWQPVGKTVATSMLLLPNWSLLWFAAPLLVWLYWKQRPSRPAAETFLLLAAGFHVLLFFFTHASAWAEDLTSLNRLLLHAAPVWVWVLAARLSRPAPIRGRYA